MKLFAFILLYVVIALSQSSNSKLNPNISVVGDLRLNHQKLTEQENLGFGFGGLELVINNYLNHFSRADITVHLSDEEKVDIEEAYVTILKGLPLNSQMRFGRYFLPFGQIQTKHAHILPYFEYPELHQAYFGEEGTRTIGAEFNFAFPVLGHFSELKLNINNGNISPSDHHHREEHSEEVDEESPALAYGLHYSVFTELGDYTHLNTSFSYFKGSNDIHYNEKINISALSAKLKWKPNDFTSLEIVSEYFLNKRNVHHESLETINNSGFFISTTYQFSKSYSVGSYYTSFENPIEEHEKNKHLALYSGYSPMEETLSFRLKYNRDLNMNTNRIVLQFLFSLGPHKTHEF